MKRLLLLLLLPGLAVDAWAQAESLYLSSQRQPVQVSVGVMYQQYEDDGTIGAVEEVSVPFMLSAPLGRRFGLSVVAHQASVTGDTLASISGVADVQLGLSYHQRLGASSLVLSLGMNLPSGKRELTPDEFNTTVLLSQHYYSFRVPGFGQGFNVSPGFVWAVPLNDVVVVGLGASYQVKGPYRPLAEPDSTYDPGDELLLTGGLDFRLAPTTNLSFDLTYTLYNEDTFAGEVYTAGDKVTATAQLLHYLGRNPLHLIGRYRSVARSTLPASLGDADTERAQRVLPAQILLRASYRQQAGSAFALGLLAQARLFDEYVLFDSASLIDLGVLPELILSQQATIRLRGVYTLGDLTGFEAGGALVLAL